MGAQQVMHAELTEAERKRRIRRNVWLLSLAAIAVYVTFITLTVLGR